MRNDKLQYLHSFVDELISLEKRNLLFKGAASSLLVFCTGTLAFMALDSIYPAGLKHVFIYRVTLIILVAAVFLYYLFRASRVGGRGRAAEYIEKKDTFNDYLSTAVEMSDEQVERYGFSPELCDMTVEGAYDYYKAKKAGDYVDYFFLKKLLKCVFIVCLSIGLFAMSGYGLKPLKKFWPALVSPFVQRPTEIISSNRDFKAFSGEEVTLKFKYDKNAPIDIYVHHTDDRQKSRFHDFPGPETPEYQDMRIYSARPVSDTVENGVYNYELTFIAPGRNFYYTARSAVSDSFCLTHFAAVSKRPAVTKINAAYEFPKYTGIASVLEENITTVSALAGTVIKMTAYSNVPVKRAELKFTGGASMAMDISAGGRSFSAAFTLAQKSGYKIAITDYEGNVNVTEKFYDINVYPDNYPHCEIIEPRGEINAPAEKKVEITVKATDDFGFSKMRLAFYKNEADEESREIAIHDPKAAEIFEKTVLDLGDVMVKPGDSLYYYIAVWDNDGVAGPKMSKSAVNKILFPSQYDEAMEIERVYDSIEARLNKITSEQKAIGQKVEELNELNKQKMMNEYEARKNFENIARRQENLVNEAKELSRDLKDVVKKMENNVYIKPETLAKITEIQQELQKVINDDLSRVMANINKNIDQTKLTAEDVKKFAGQFDEKKLLDKFERLKELFAKAEREQKLSTFVKELESVLNRQEVVMENTEKSSPDVKELNENLASEQKDLRQNYDRAISDFEKNSEKISEISEGMKEAAKAAADDLKKEDVSGRMQKSGDDLAKMNPKDAFGEQKKITEALKRNIDGLKKAFDEFKDKNKKQIQNSLASLIEKTIRMSAIEEEIYRGFVGAEELRVPAVADRYVETLDELSEKCIETANLCKLVVSELMDVSKKSILIDKNHIAMAGVILNLFSSIRPALAERQLPQAINMSRNIYVNTNVLSMMLIDALDMINNSKSGSNMDQLMEMIKKQAEMQAKLNAKTKSMMKKPGEDGDMGEGGMPQLSMDGMKSLAFEQQMIRRSLERVMDGMDGNGEMARKLREMRTEMRNLESEYMRKNIGSKIQSRQKILHERLLEMQKALFKEKQTTERKAEAAKNFEVKAPVPALKPVELKKQELRMDEAIKNEKYPEAYEKIIELYMRAIQKI